MGGGFRYLVKTFGKYGNIEEVKEEVKEEE